MLRPLALCLLLSACDASQGGWDPDGAPGPGPTGTDGGTPSSGDMAGGPSQPIGPTGGSVSLLHFGVSGDTRPANCDDTSGYPTMIINGIVGKMNERAVQFAMDLGDHMFVCNGSMSEASTQMGLFTAATQGFHGTWFMTMGNHECAGPPCLSFSQNANYLAFMKALTPLSAAPYYSFDVDTSLGRATFVVVADSAWEGGQQSWLQSTLTTADAQAKYTIVVRHHPESDTSITTNPQSMAIIRAHKFALLLTGHSHLYRHSTYTDGGRDLVLGTGGAPLVPGASYGYAVIDQLPTDELQVSIYDLASDTLADQWKVGPNQ
jgi:hypothetical protein